MPDVAACVPSQLQVTAWGTPMHVELRGKKQPHYFTNLTVFVTNLGPGPCYLMGSPVVALRQKGVDVGGPYTRERSDLSEVQVGGVTEFALSPLLLPFAASHQHAELNGSWDAPYCGKATKAVVTIKSASGDWTATGGVPSPPCRGSREDAGTNTSGWAVLTAR